MNPSQELRGELIDLVARLHDGEATDDDRQHLFRLIDADAAAWQFYINYSHLTACLRWTLGPSPSAEPVETVSQEWLPGMFPAPMRHISADTLTAPLEWKRTARRSLPWIGLGAAMVAAAYWGLVVLALAPRAKHAGAPEQLVNQSVEATSEPSAAKSSVASVLALRDCVWAAANNDITATIPKAGDRLSPRAVLQLLEGQAELQFDDGANVIVQGPAEFRVESPKRGHLKVGRLGATVPEKARGFEIATAAALIVDLGTEFSVEVDSGGKAEVQVIRGEVQLTPAKVDIAAAQPLKSIRLRRGEAARVDPLKSSVQAISADPQKAVVTKPAKLQITHHIGKTGAFPASGSDLIESGSATLLRAKSSVSKALHGSGPEALNNGTIYDGNDAVIGTPTCALCPPNEMSVLYDLNLEKNSAGYDLMWIMSVSGATQGRRSQHWRVEVSRVDDDTFEVLAGEDRIHFVDNDTGEMHVKLERADKQLLAQRVDQIRFTFFDVPDAWLKESMYREIDVFGRPTRLTERPK